MSRAAWNKFFQNYEPWFFLTPALLLILIVVIYPVVYGTIIGFFDKAVPWPSEFVVLKILSILLQTINTREQSLTPSNIQFPA